MVGLGNSARPVNALSLVCVVDRDLFRIGALLLELGNVRARHERLAAGAAEHDDAHALVVGEIVEDVAGAPPHVARHGVVAFRIVEDQIADAAFLAGQNLVGLGHCVAHCVRSCSKSFQMALALCEIGDLLLAEAEFLEHRRRCARRCRAARAASLLGVRDSVNGCASMVLRAVLALDGLRGLEMFHLRVGKHLIDLVDRARSARRPR